MELHSVVDGPAQAGLLSRELQQLWFSIAPRRWSSVAIVPAPGVTSVLPLARSLLTIGRRGSEGSCVLVDGTRASLDQVPTLVRAIAARVDQGERVLLVVDPVHENPASLALASSCDAAVLCVALGRSDLASAGETLERLGRTRFLGSVVLKPER